MCDSYPKAAERIIHAFCESDFSTLLQMKTKQQSRLEVENYLRCALSSTPPHIQKLAKKKQSQLSH
jgi:hypothetical protein